MLQNSSIFKTRTPFCIIPAKEDIVKSFKKLREYDIHGFVGKADDGKRNVIKNFNKFANGVNQFFPTMLKTRIGDMGDGLNSIYDRIKEDVNKEFPCTLSVSLFR